MILTTHILTGAALGASAKNPYAIAGLSIVLHFLLDFFPHGDYLNKKTRFREIWKGLLDFFAGIFVVAAIVYFRQDFRNEALLVNILTGVFFSLLPDFTTFLYLFLGMKFVKPIYNLHQKLHLLHYPDFAPEREFSFKNNLWDILV